MSRKNAAANAPHNVGHEGTASLVSDYDGHSVKVTVACFLFRIRARPKALHLQRLIRTTRLWST